MQQPQRKWLVQATKEDFAYRHAHSKMSQNFTVSTVTCLSCLEG